MRGIVLLIGFLFAGCLSDGDPHIAFNDTPKDVGDGWSIAIPEEVGMNSAALEQAYKDWWYSDDFRTAYSLIVIRHGKLIREGYARNLDDRIRIMHIQSTTKSIVSLVLGIVRGLGYLEDLNERLYEIMPEAFDGVSEAKRSITIRHLLTMTSGINFDDEDFTLEIDSHAGAAGHPMNYILRKPMYAEPGEKFYYRSMDPHLLSGAIQKVTGQTLLQLANEHLFSPLGIKDIYWEADTEGHSFGGNGLYLRPRDLAKIGQMVLQKGIWNGRQIVSEEWLVQATSSQVQPPEDDNDFINRGYGFYWWLYYEWDAVGTSGHGRNDLYVFPKEDMVIVHTATPDSHIASEAYITMDMFGRIINEILKSIDDTTSN